MTGIKRHRGAWLIWGAVLFLLCCGCWKAKQDAKPVWTTDLLQDPVYAALSTRLEHELPAKWITPQLAFVGSNTLAVSFHDGDQKLVTSLSQLRHFHFLTIFVNAQDGKFSSRDLSWPTMDTDSKLLPMRDGGFVVVAGEQMYRYSPFFQLLRKTVVPGFKNNGSSEFGSPPPPTLYVWQKENWYAQKDPPQKFVILGHITDQSAKYFWLDGNTLKVTESVRLPSSGGWSYTKWGYGYSASKNALIKGYGEKTFIYRPGQGWQPFCPAYNATATFASEHRVFLDSSGKEGNRIVLISDDCRYLMEEPGGFAGGRVVTRSASENRIAIWQGYMDNTFSGVFFTDRVRVWNLAPAREIFNLTFVSHGIRTGVWGHNPWFAAALSPDGKLLAIILGSKLMLYSV